MTTSRGMVVLGVAAAVAATAAPLQAQDPDSVYAVLYQSLRQPERFAEPEVRIAPQPPRGVSSPFRVDGRSRRPPQTVREKKRSQEKVETAKPVRKEPAKPANIPANPHLALMTDPTLQPGDIAIFPDGPRVFQGNPGNRHSLSDFVPVAKAKGLAKADRKYLMALRTGVNEAWVEAAADGRLARNSRDVEATGSISKKRKRR
jgi:hypothetical protein